MSTFRKCITVYIVATAHMYLKQIYHNAILGNFCGISNKKRCKDWTDKKNSSEGVLSFSPKLLLWLAALSLPFQLLVHNRVFHGLSHVFHGTSACTMFLLDTLVQNNYDTLPGHINTAQIKKCNSVWKRALQSKALPFNFSIQWGSMRS